MIEKHKFRHFPRKFLPFILKNKSILDKEFFVQQFDQRPFQSAKVEWELGI